MQHAPHMADARVLHSGITRSGLGYTIIDSYKIPEQIRTQEQTLRVTLRLAIDLAIDAN